MGSQLTEFEQVSKKHSPQVIRFLKSPEKKIILATKIQSWQYRDLFGHRTPQF